MRKYYFSRLNETQVQWNILWNSYFQCVITSKTECQKKKKNISKYLTKYSWEVIKFISLSSRVLKRIRPYTIELEKKLQDFYPKWNGGKKPSTNPNRRLGNCCPFFRENQINQHLVKPIHCWLYGQTNECVACYALSFTIYKTKVYYYNCYFLRKSKLQTILYATNFG